MVVGQLLGFLSFEIYGKLEEHFQLHAQLFFLLVPELEPTLLSRTIDSSFFLLARRNLWFFSQMKRASCLLSKFLIFGKIDLGKKLESNKCRVPPTEYHRVPSGNQKDFGLESSNPRALTYCSQEWHDKTVS